jgi:hypothetical protein
LKPLVTKDCESHHTNWNYETLLLLFDGSELNVRPKGLRFNWQPTDQEVMTVVRELAFISPTFAEDLVRFAVTLDTWHSKPRARSKPVTDVAELIL